MCLFVQKHHYHELTIETQERLGPIPNKFMRYWIERFPRLLSHSYHALQSCCNEPIFTGYYPRNYVFTKPNYFYEETEDFKPFDGGVKTRDSPKRFNQDYRYKPMNYPNFVMDRKNGSKLQNNGLMNTNDGNSMNYNRSYKKGSYNFHNRFWNNSPSNSKLEPSENFRNNDNSRVQDIDEGVREDTKIDRNENDKKCNNEDEREKPVENVWNIDHLNKEDNNKIEDGEKDEKNKVQDKQEFQGQAKKGEYPKQNDKHILNKKKSKVDSNTPKEPVEVDDDGFTKVKYRNNNSGSKKQNKNSDANNENVNWIVPGRENKEQK